jgi:hypothetical protein
MCFGILLLQSSDLVQLAVKYVQSKIKTFRNITLSPVRYWYQIQSLTLPDVLGTSVYMGPGTGAVEGTLNGKAYGLCSEDTRFCSPLKFLLYYYESHNAGPLYFHFMFYHSPWMLSHSKPHNSYNRYVSEYLLVLSRQGSKPVPTSNHFRLSFLVWARFSCRQT